jgi:ribosomal protein S18 acetylase RimI-like enzyme
MLPEGFQIRRYLPRDEDAVYEICLKTGDSGKDGTHLYDDPKALGHIYVGPYIHLEPELAFVVEDQQGVCGYVMGVMDSKKFYQAYVDKWLPDIRKRYPEPTGDQAGWTRTQKVFYDYYHPDVFCPEPYDQYPSHLHIDMLPRVQGRGLGIEMMQVLLKAMAARKTPGVHLGMAASNARAEKFYKKLGFHELLRTGDSLYLGKRFP